MPGWQKTPADRQRDNHVYGSPEYRRGRAAARRRANGRCESCGHRHARLECDHITHIAGGPPDHSLGNLQMLCRGPGTCKCHERKSAAEGNRGKRKPEPAVERRTEW